MRGCPSSLQSALIAGNVLLAQKRPSKTRSILGGTRTAVEAITKFLLFGNPKGLFGEESARTRGAA